MTKVYTFFFVLAATISLSLDAQTAFKPAQQYNITSQSVISDVDNEITTTDRARAMLPDLLRAVFNAKWKDESVLLTVDARWSADSLKIFYNYYRGVNVLSLEDDQLIEKIVFTVHPEQIDALDTEEDEFLFLYLRNSGRYPGVHSKLYRPGTGETEENWVSSLGFPVKRDNLPGIIQLLKALRSPAKS